MRAIALAAALFAAPAFAQEPAPQPQQSPVEQAMIATLTEQLGTIIRLRAQLVEMQRALAAAQTPSVPAP